MATRNIDNQSSPQFKINDIKALLEFFWQTIRNFCDVLELANYLFGKTPTNRQFKIMPSRSHRGVDGLAFSSHLEPQFERFFLDNRIGNGMPSLPVKADHLYFLTALHGCILFSMRTELLEGAKLFNLGEYWEAHEVWEVPWNAAKARGDVETANYIQGLILLAAAIHKRRHYDNLVGGQRNYQKALNRLKGNDHSALDGFDLEKLKQEVWAALEDTTIKPQIAISFC